MQMAVCRIQLFALCDATHKEAYKWKDDCRALTRTCCAAHLMLVDYHMFNIQRYVSI